MTDFNRFRDIQGITPPMRKRRGEITLSPELLIIAVIALVVIIAWFATQFALSGKVPA